MATFGRVLACFGALLGAFWQVLTPYFALSVEEAGGMGFRLNGTATEATVVPFGVRPGPSVSISPEWFQLSGEAPNSLQEG
jgi:hypothetical protein